MMFIIYNIIVSYKYELMIIDAKSFSDLVLLKFIGNKYKIIDSMTIN